MNPALQARYDQLLRFRDDPEVAALIRAGRAGTVQRGEWTIDVQPNGKINASRGSVVPGLLAAAGVLAGGAGLTYGLGAGSAAAGVGGAGSSALRGLTDVARVAAPIAGMALSTRNGGGTAPATDPTTQGYLNRALQYGNERLERVEPVHKAAMLLAQSLAPSGPNPRLAEANLAAMAPRPQTQLDPRVLEAIQRLMGGLR